MCISVVHCVVQSEWKFVTFSNRMTFRLTDRQTEEAFDYARVLRGAGRKSISNILENFCGATTELYRRIPA